MECDSEKWALSFYGVVDERLSIETDAYRIRIYRKDKIKILEVERVFSGTPDIYIPSEWDMELYSNQAKLRRSISSVVRKDAQEIFNQRTRVYASRFNIPYKNIEIVAAPHYKGKYCGDTIKYNMWMICGTNLDMIDYLVCHELAHYYERNHNDRFWKKVENMFYVWNDDVNSITGEKALLLDAEFNKNLTSFALMYWGSPYYLKSFYSDGLVKKKTPLICPSYKETRNGKKIDAIYTTFTIKF